MEEYVMFVIYAGYVPNEIFNYDKTGLFLNKMSRRIYITQEDMSLPGNKPMKDRLTLLL